MGRGKHRFDFVAPLSLQVAAGGMTRERRCFKRGRDAVLRFELLLYSLRARPESDSSSFSAATTCGTPCALR